MSELKLYNTLTRTKEILKPIHENYVTLYTCGPTIYDFAHIGNFRTYIFEDLLKRVMHYFGLQVKHVMNITDVEDKTIRGAVAKGIPLTAYTQPFKEAFLEDVKTLHIIPADAYPEATGYIPQMIGMIERLLEKEIAYQGADGSVYFAIRKFPGYGSLSHFHLEELEVGASERVSTDEYDKEHASDFVLWKAHDPKRDGDIYWESPFGKGRPGWHLECSTMSMKLLGDTIDIHCGGIDNMFPHHENEIAQSEAYSDKIFVHIWMHAEHLIVENRKMSKSFGNFYTLRDLLSKGYQGKQIRYLLLQTHYRTQLNFTFEGLDGAKNSLQRLNDFIHRMEEIESRKNGQQTDAKSNLTKAKSRFEAALADDLNISEALASLFDLVREINFLADANQIHAQDATEVLQLMRQFDTVLGVLEFHQGEELIPIEVQNALEQRNLARKEKNWQLADKFRDFILDKGYLIEDSSSGSRLKKK